VTAPSGEVQELAAAIRDALDVPIADTRNPGAEHAEEMLRLKRVTYVRGVLEGLAAGAGSVADTVALIRGAAVEFPVTYPVRQRARVAS
jgi:outer membrane receptor for ferric coprogen and ferric-rhodotorulic acid